MARKTHQKHFQRKEYKSVDKWLEANSEDTLFSGVNITANNPIMQADVAQQLIEKAEATNPYLVSTEQQVIFVNDVVNPLSTMTDMCYLAEFVKRRYSENARALQLYHSRLLDIQHEIEMLPAKNAPKGYRVYKEQRDILLRRRVAKDENAMLEPLKELIDKNPEVFRAMAEVLNQIQHIDKNRMERKYHYRAPELIAKKVDE